MHHRREPEILYFGTPVVLISTCNEDQSYNLAPISSIFWLGWRCVIGIAGSSKTTQNIRRTNECVLNLPSVNEAAAVNKLALTTGSDPVPPGKIKKGYRHERDKFGLSGFTSLPSETVLPPRVKECPVHMEATVEAIHNLNGMNESQRGSIVTIELRIQRVHLDDSILMAGHSNRVDPDKWRPLIMSFQQFYGLSQRIHTSTLAEIPETSYHSNDMDVVRNISGLLSAVHER